MYFTVPSSKKPHHHIIFDDEIKVSKPHPKAITESSDNDQSNIEDETPNQQ